MTWLVARWLLVVVCLQGLAGCSIGYYLHSARGQAALMAQRVPIDKVIADPATAPDLRVRLEYVREARAFASAELGLPAGKGYRTYAALDRPYAVWSVSAAGEFSLAPVTWCFPVTGCVSYRGYFSEDKAADFAAGLFKRGYDVAVRGVSAYSTLGFFDDPVLSTMMHWDDERLVAIIFHELAHQLLYVRDDTAFNESFASVVEEAGMARWTAFRGNQDALATYRRRQRWEACFHNLIGDARQRLESLYASGMPPEKMRAAKSAVFAALKADYRNLREQGAITPGYDAWFAQALNNAHLAAAGAYQEWVPALRALLAGESEDLASFYREAASLAELGVEARRSVLNGLAPAASPGVCAKGPMQAEAPAADG